MASMITTVFLVCCIYSAFGASVYKQNYKETVRGIRNISRPVNIVKRASSSPTFETEPVGKQLQENVNPVFLNTISRHEGVFLDSVPDGFNEIMHQIFTLRSDKWTGQRNTIVSELSCITTNIRNSVTVGQFYIGILNIYTTECVYDKVNLAIRNFRTQTESAFGSFALMLNVILSQWGSLSKYKYTTYRGMGDSFNAEPYTLNTIFTWPDFTSSSSNKTSACSFARIALFIIDNSEKSDWRPRAIEDYSNYPDEAEYLYPASAIFKVTRVVDGACGKFYLKEIYISLQRGNSKRFIQYIYNDNKGVGDIGGFSRITAVVCATNNSNLSMSNQNKEA